jgi:hypothetical protein
MLTVNQLGVPETLIVPGATPPDIDTATVCTAGRASPTKASANVMLDGLSETVGMAETTKLTVSVFAATPLTDDDTVSVVL